MTHRDANLSDRKVGSSIWIEKVKQSGLQLNICSVPWQARKIIPLLFRAGTVVEVFTKAWLGLSGLHCHCCINLQTFECMYMVPPKIKVLSTPSWSGAIASQSRCCSPGRSWAISINTLRRSCPCMPCPLTTLASSLHCLGKVVPRPVICMCQLPKRRVSWYLENATNAK